MSMTLKKQKSHNHVSRIWDDIESHSAWYGRISGLKADKMLRDTKKPYLYIIRAGEIADDYYISFVQPDFTVKHQPFVITETTQGWYYENSTTSGIYTDDIRISDVAHLIMHCRKEECTPLNRIV